MESSRIQAAARKALMAANPLYHAWSPEQQELFRATMSDAASDRVEAVLLGELLGISCTAENAGEMWRGLPFAKLGGINWGKLLTTGIGEDMIWLNESMANSVSLLDFETLHDYDYGNYLIEEGNQEKELAAYSKPAYYAFWLPYLARLILNGKLHYATLSSLSTYLTEQVEEQGWDMIQRLIPHRYMDGKDHGKWGDSGVIWDTKVDAGGLEPHIEELRRRWIQYLRVCWIELNQSFSRQAPVVFMKDISHAGVGDCLFLFNNADALKRTRWRRFLSDCREMARELSELERWVGLLWKQSEGWLQSMHQDIMQNFDPKVSILSRRQESIIAPGTFDDLLR